MQLRLQVILARAGIASRRAAETLIEEGKVSVNGKVVNTPGSKADPDRDVITVSGRKIELNRQSRYILVNKPEGTITSKSDPEGRPTVMALLPKELQELHPVGRLDWATEGVLLFTDDGTMTHALTHPSFEVERVYHVKLKGKLGEEDAVRWLEGATLEDGHARAESAEVLGTTGKHTWLQITLHEGKNREVRRLGEALRYDVLRLRRHSFAGLTLEGVPPGGYRFLDLDEIERLRYIAKEHGARIEEKPVAAAPAGVPMAGQVVATKGHRGALAYDLTPRGIAPTTQRGTTKLEGYDDEGNPLPKPLPPPKPEEYIGRHGTRTWVSDDAQKSRPARPVREDEPRQDWRERAPDVKERIDSRPNRGFQQRDDRPPRAGDDRPKRSFGPREGDGRPPRREFNSDRPRRDGPSTDRPQNNFRGDRSSGERPRRDAQQGDNRPPRRDFRDRPPQNRADGERPPRRDDQQGDRRPPRDGDNRPPRREFNNDRPQGDQRQGDRRGPSRSDNRDNNRSGGNRDERKRFPPRGDRPNQDEPRKDRDYRASDSKSPRPKHRGKTRD